MGLSAARPPHIHQHVGSSGALRVAASSKFRATTPVRNSVPRRLCFDFRAAERFCRSIRTLADRAARRRPLKVTPLFTRLLTG